MAKVSAIYSLIVAAPSNCLAVKVSHCPLARQPTISSRLTLMGRCFSDVWMDLPVRRQRDMRLAHTINSCVRSAQPRSRRLLTRRHINQTVSLCQSFSRSSAERYYSVFELRKSDEQLFWKLIAQSSSPARRKLIYEAKGVLPSSLDNLPGWVSTRDAPFEPMHCILLGEHTFGSDNQLIT